MIHTVPNPTMTPEEIKAFRENFARCVSKNITPEQKAAVRQRLARMKDVYDNIIRNSGGKNAILEC